MRSIKFLLILIFTTFITCQQNTFSQSEKNSSKIKSEYINLINTTWSGTDSDGDFYEYTFLEGGKIIYKTNTSRDIFEEFNSEDTDCWVQNGNIIIIILGNFSVQKGTINENTIEGIAWNNAEKRWTWNVKKIPNKNTTQ